MLAIKYAGLRTDRDAMFARQPYGFCHGPMGPGMPSASDVRRRNAPHQCGVLAAFFPYVSVQVDAKQCFDVGHACNSCHIPGVGISTDLFIFKGFCSARPLRYSCAVGLWFTAGRRKCWGEPGRLPGRGRLRAPHPVPALTQCGSNYTPAPSGYSSASFSSRASVSTVVPLRFQAPSVSNRKSPILRPHGAMTRPIAR